MDTSQIYLHQNILFLQGNLNFDSVAEIYQNHFSAVIKEIVQMDEQTFILDLSKVKQIDSSAMALIIEFYRELEQAGKTISTRAVSAKLKSLADLCDVDGFFME